MNEIKKFDDLGDIIKYLRWYARISQGKLAQIIETSQTSISAWERGAQEPLYSQVKKLVKYIDDNKIPVSLF